MLMNGPHMSMLYKKISLIYITSALEILPHVLTLVIWVWPNISRHTGLRETVILPVGAHFELIQSQSKSRFSHLSALEKEVYTIQAKILCLNTIVHIF